MDLLKPEYNILKIAGSSLYFKHSEETLMKFRARKHTEETKAKISSAQIGRKASEKTRAKLLNRIRSEQSGRPKVQIEVFDQETAIKTIYQSMREAAQAICVKTENMSRYLSQGSLKPFKGRYYLKKIQSDMKTGGS
jgi:group I intron endonuclease